MAVKTWLEQAELLLRRLRPEALQVFDATGSLLSRSTQLAYLLLAEHLVSAQQRSARTPLLVGIGGGQGAGKSTLVEFVAQLIAIDKGLSVQVLSLDDFYLGKAERRQLAASVHPLFATRGVPGTHHMPLLRSVVDQLQSGDCPFVPIFDKAADDLFPTQQWRQATAKPDIVLLEGWCVGASPQPAEQMISPVNKLERERDADGSWRNEVNRQLAGDYAALFNRLDQLVYLQVPDMDAVRRWRYQQEPAGGLSPQQVAQFIQYFERLTLWMQQDLPNRADVVLALSADHGVEFVSFNPD